MHTSLEELLACHFILHFYFLVENLYVLWKQSEYFNNRKVTKERIELRIAIVSLLTYFLPS